MALQFLRKKFKLYDQPVLLLLQSTWAFILNVKETINVTNTRKILVLLGRFGTVKNESKRGRGKYGQKNGDVLSI